MHADNPSWQKNLSSAIIHFDKVLLFKNILWLGKCRQTQVLITELFFLRNHDRLADGTEITVWSDLYSAGCNKNTFEN